MPRGAKDWITTGVWDAKGEGKPCRHTLCPECKSRGLALAEGSACPSVCK